MDETLKARSFNIASHIDEFDDVFAYREPSFLPTYFVKLASASGASLLNAEGMDTMIDRRTLKQRRDGDFEALMCALSEAIAHAKGEPEGAGVRVFVPGESLIEKCGAKETSR